MKAKLLNIMKRKLKITQEWIKPRSLQKTIASISYT